MMTAVTNSAGESRRGVSHWKRSGSVTAARPDFDGYLPHASDEKEHSDVRLDSWGTRPGRQMSWTSPQSGATAAYAIR
jgi:hypothetical protein